MADELPVYEIRQMKKEDIPQVLDLRRETNLSEGIHSVETWFEFDPEGFYVAVTPDGEVLGICAGVLQHEDLVFIGMYTVKSTYQRRGIGKKIWDKVMERVGDRNAGFNPVPKMLSKYMGKAGFPVQCDWLSVVCVSSEPFNPEISLEIPEVDISILKPDQTDLVKAVSDYQSGVIGFAREGLIQKLCSEEDSVTMVATRKQDGSVCGYGSIRQNMKENGLVGPLFADDSDVAEGILYHLVKAFPVAESKGVTLMIVDCNESAVAMVEKLGFSMELCTERLYRKEEVIVQFHKVFAQHNLSFSVF